MSDQKDSNIISLIPAKEFRERLTKKQYLSTDERIKDLEEDVLRLIEFSMQLEQDLNSQIRFTRKLLHLLKEQEEVSSSSGQA